MLANTEPNVAISSGLAVTREELDTASRLVHECYLRCGYVSPSPDGRHASPYLTMPSTAVFVARAHGDIVATAALVRDSERLLPCDDLYGPYMRTLRRAGHCLGEVSALAVSDLWRGAGLQALRSLIRVIGVYGRDLAELDRLCITVHPRHAAFYESRLHFRRFGDTKPYGAVNGAPAVGLVLDLDELDSRPDPDKSLFAATLFGAGERLRLRAILVRERARAAAYAALRPFQEASLDAAAMW